MLIQVNRDNQLTPSEAPTEQIEEIVSGRLSRVADRLTRVEVHVGDVNASKGGTRDKKCSVELRPENLKPVAGTAEAPTVEAAVRAATDKALHAYDNVVGKLSART